MRNNKIVLELINNGYKLDKDQIKLINELPENFNIDSVINAFRIERKTTNNVPNEKNQMYQSWIEYDKMKENEKQRNWENVGKMLLILLAFSLLGAFIRLLLYLFPII